MSQKIDLVYDRLVADEKLKSGTKYERLAAIAFRILTNRTTVHDLRLKGGVGVPHQIDVVVGDDKKRVLVEAKDYDRKASLPVVRDFSAVVQDLRPDESFVVSTVGFSKNAQKWAEAAGMKLAILRPPEDEADWGDILKRINVDLRFSAPTDPRVEWIVDASEAERFKDGRNPIGRLWFDDLYLSKVGQDPEPLRGVLEPEMHRELGRLPAGEAGQLRGEQAFTEPRLLHLPGQDPIKVVGYSWTQDVVSGTRSFSVGIGVGGLVGELVFRTMDGSIHRIFTNRQIASWTFDGKDVVPR